jgi:hypothetical protein
MGNYARIDTATGNILARRDEVGFNPLVGEPKPGQMWVPRIAEDAGSGPIVGGITENVVLGPVNYEGRQFDRRVAVVTTRREKNTAELDGEKDQLVDVLTANESFLLIYKVLFRIVNDVRTLQTLPSVTSAQFKTFLRSLL